MFNRDLFIAFAGALISGALVSRAIAELAPLTNAVISIISETGVFLLIFGVLFYRRHRGEYVDDTTGKVDMKKLKWVVVKLGSTMSVAELEYNTLKPYIHFLLLGNGYDPFASSMIASAITFAGYLLVADVMAHYVKLLKK